MWSAAFDLIKFDWFYLERLSCSSRQASREYPLKTDFGSNADLHMSWTKHKRSKCAIFTLPWKITDQQDRFCHLFGVTLRFEWVKFDVSLKTGVLLIIGVDPNYHLVRLIWSTAFDPCLNIVSLEQIKASFKALRYDICNPCFDVTIIREKEEELEREKNLRKDLEQRYKVNVSYRAKGLASHKVVICTAFNAPCAARFREWAQPALSIGWIVP